MWNKKAALFFAPILVVLMVIGLIFAWSAITGKHNAFNKKIGEKQFELINTYQTGEKALFYIDQSAKYSVYQSIYDLAQNGGCINGEKYFGYTLWDTDNQNQCYPDGESSKNNFFTVLSNNLNNYLSKYEHVELLLDNYNFELESKNLIGIAKDVLEIPINGKETGVEPSGTYFIKPSFNITINIDNYDFSDYDELRAMAEQLVSICENKNSELCISENIFDIFNKDELVLGECRIGQESYEFLESIEKSGTKYRIYGLCVKSNNYKFYSYDENDGKTALRNMVYKFALQFEDLPCDDDGYDITKCRELSCGEYYSCESKDICLCPDSSSLSNACYGDCPLCWWSSWSIGACGGGGCAETDELWTRLVMPSNCVDGSKCEFNPCCEDPVCCGEYPPACDCGGNPCCTPVYCPPPEPEDPPEEPPEEPWI